MGFYTNPAASTSGNNPATFRIAAYTTNGSLGQQFHTAMYVATANQTITKLVCYCPAVQSGSVIQLGIYNSGGTLLGSGTVTTASTVGFYQVTLGTAVTLAVATQYYLAILNQTNETVTRFAAQSTANDPLVTNVVGSTTTMPSTRTTNAASGLVYYINPLS